MADAQTIIRQAILRKFPDAVVTVRNETAGYKVDVKTPKLADLPRADQQAEIYAAIQRLPFSLLAKIQTLTAA